MSPFLGSKFSLATEYVSGADDKYEISNYNGDEVVKASFIDNVFDDMVRKVGDLGDVHTEALAADPRLQLVQQGQSLLLH